jgi:lipopolysaccharide exporter
VRRLVIPRISLQHGSVARNLVVVGGATALGQGAIVIAGPILVRLYDPEAFGLLSIYAAALSVLLAAASLRYDLAIPLASDLSEAAHLFLLCLFLGLVTSVVLGILILVWGPQIARLLGANGLAPYLWLLPVALFVASFSQALGSLAVYMRSFTSLARMRAIQGAAQAISQGVLGLVAAGPFGLIAGDLIGRVLGTEQLFRALANSLRPTALSLARVRACARDRWGFARVMSGASLISSLSLQTPFLLIPLLFGLAASGQYFLAYRLMVLPASLVSAAVSQVFFGEASYRRADRMQLRDLAKNAAVSLFVLSIPTYAIVMINGPSLVETVFGAQWREAGLFAQIMAPWMMIWSVANPISSMLLVGRRERESLFFTIAELALRAGAILVGAYFGSLTLGVVVLSVASILINISALWRFLRVVSIRLRELVRPAGRILTLTLPSLLLVLITNRLPNGGLIVGTVAGWVLAVGLAARLSPELRGLLAHSND